MRTTGENLKVTLGDTTICYSDIGPASAPAMIFLHGFPLNRKMWELQAEVLKSNFRVICPDLRGFGESGGGDDASLQVMVQDLLQFMDALEIPAAMIGGHSLGGYVALNAVCNHPERFHAAVFSGIQCNGDSAPVNHERERLTRRIRNYNIENYADELLAQLFCHRSFITRKEEVRAVRDMIISTSEQAVLKGTAILGSRPDLCVCLPQISIPVLIISGKEDEVTPPGASEYMHYSIQGSQKVLVEYSGHMVNLENTHEFNVHLKKFVEEVCHDKKLSRHCAVSQS